MIQPLAYIHPQAKIAGNVVIEPFVTIHKDVVIEEGTWIGSNVTIMDGARIGKNCRIFPGAVISGIPQDLKFDGEETTAEIGDNTTIRECVTVNRGTKDKWKTVIGKNCLIQAYSHIAHDCIVGDNCIFSNNSTLAGHITVGDYVVLAGMVAVHQFCHIGSHAFIAGGSLVRKDVPPFVKAAREPLSYVGINSVGLRRRGFSSNQINEIQDIYRVLFVKNNNLAKALDIIEAEYKPTEIRDEILDFVRNSNRGVMKGFGQSKGLL
ncbi:acyl-ACP--UDP-N-acetylglucosamine O-acyltransferase [Parapedobacter indicus]|uniref:Acyl-[acyl-carrier-protein]--UDP-N-acetylglucosamine O-acyltransferase n=1 Tax=Parapedobacter indicus TaxID=1477437 RepID=A0A1I3KIY9_9SPHI|nr:acyl-ACP--UDP-N-acetylglucosamine O-acyltransferase [Parapedobacter indicus]PPL01836.1 acyl-[acyl-carrier-protein]--UDP-N-acetylglucosamine O-acyltransferase [Parapedobacter indicus]SFI72453.1 acyl-[acyl-carrier-protein]--UDP-N-acetylglucosamine O-acyltransferase [Parapedobacter indicus]